MITTAALSRLAASGDTDAAFRLGYRLAFCRATESRNPKGAVRQWLAAARAGHIRAKFYLGTAYDFGHGVGKSPRLAMRWYAAAAKGGHSEAQYNLALGFRDGIGVSRDLRKAARWLRAAAEQGNSDAQSDLGYCFHEGIGARRDLKTAARWYSKAVELGSLALSLILVFASATVKVFAGVRFKRVDGLSAQLSAGTQAHDVFFAAGRITRKLN